MQHRHHLARVLAGCLCASMLLAASASATRLPQVSQNRSESPDGDPPLEIITFPAGEFPLDHAATIPSPGTSGRTITAEFIPTGIDPEGDTPSGVAMTPDGAKIVVAHRDTRNLVVLDAATRVFEREIALSGSPNGVAISPDGTRAVTPNVFEDTASIIDLTTGSEIAVVAVGDQPGVVRIAPDGTIAAIGNTVSGSISVIDIATAVELRRIAGVGFVGSIGISFEAGVITFSPSEFEFAGNSTLVHPDYYGNRILIVNTSTGAVTPLTSSNTPRGVAVTPDGTKAVVTHTGAVQILSVVDPAVPAIVNTIAVGADLGGPVTIDPTGTKAVVAVLNACRVVNLTTGGVSPSLATASVNQLVTTADGGYALGVGFRGSLISYATETVVRELNNVVSTALGAVSPAGPRAAMVANLFGEDMLVVNTNGAGGFIEGVIASGPPPEGDKARTAAVRPDGSEAVAASILSDNVSIVDLQTSATAAILPVGNRPAEVAITPDGTKAVVANLDSDFVSVIDLLARTVTNITITTRGGEVEISPDGQYAYVAVVTSDGVWRINLQTLSVAGLKLTTGNMGSISYAFSQTSGMTVSPDGATLVTCNSFDNTISIIDTGTWAVVKTLTVGTFPVRATFSPDNSLIYISNRESDSITVVANAGGSSTVLSSILVGDWPFDMVVQGSTLYVSNFQSRNIGVVDLVGGAMTATIPLPDPPAGIALDPAGAFLYATSGTWSVTLGPGPVFSIAKSGQFTIIDTGTRTIVDQALTGLPPAMLAFSPTAGIAAAPSPFGDGITVVNGLGPTGLDDPTPAPAVTFAGATPNPMHDLTTFGFRLDAPTTVELSIHDVNGRQIAAVNDNASAGNGVITWNGRDPQGHRVPAGTYFARLRAGGNSLTSKVVVIR